MLAPAELVRDFVNTYALDSDADELASPAELAIWLRERGLIGTRDRATDEDLTAALTLREVLRMGLRRETPEMPGLLAFPLLVRVGATPDLIPVEDGVRGGLARLAAAVTDQSWHRLKVCAESMCQWAFIDSSKNRSRSWCSMRVCGNRTKTRAYRARKQGSRHLQGSNTDTV